MKPCVKCGASERYHNGDCAPCRRAYDRFRDCRDKEKRRAKKARWYKNNREAALERMRLKRLENPELMRTRVRAYKLANRGLTNAIGARYRASKRQRTPAWADTEAIKFFYECCPAGFEVDHALPLSGALICGLHVSENLQWLSRAENAQKHNRFIP